MTLQRNKSRTRIEEYLIRKVTAYPNLYHVLRFVYALYSETRFLVHAIASRKFFIRYSTKRFLEFSCRQKVLQYTVHLNNFPTVHSFRHWLQMNEIWFLEGRWTFYLPSQDSLSRHFGFLTDNYPPDAGLKILTDFRRPGEAKYADHKQHPSAGAAFKRHMTYSPVSLLRVANYLYLHGLGMRVYDLVALKGAEQALCCYIVQHVKGRDVRQEDYEIFMKKLKNLIETGEITTIHENIQMMSDFNPANCKRNLIMSEEDGKPLYVDFQGFLLDEEKWLNRIVDEVKDKVDFGDVRFFRGRKKYLYQSIPGLAVGKRDTDTRWNYFIEMLREGRCSLHRRVVYDIGCNMGLMLYNALAEGAQWGIGWDLPDVVENAKKILLGLGATRFDLLDEEISEKTDFVSKIPVRYREKRNGILFFLAVRKHLGFPRAIEELPWEYMFYEGHAEETLAMALDRLRNVSWLKGVKIVSKRCFADGDTPERAVLLLTRKVPHPSRMLTGDLF